MVPAHRQNTVRNPRLLGDSGLAKEISPAEFRGPGIRHHFEDSGDDYDMDVDQRTRGVGGRSGRIILLGDGTEVLTDSDETEMFDHDEEDKDLDSQVNKGGPQSEESRSRSEREETPGPQPQPPKDQVSPKSIKSENPFDTPRSSTSETNTTTESPEETVRAIPESALPEKLVSPAKS